MWEMSPLHQAGWNEAHPTPLCKLWWDLRCAPEWDHKGISWEQMSPGRLPAVDVVRGSQGEKLHLLPLLLQQSSLPVSHLLLLGFFLFLLVWQWFYGNWVLVTRLFNTLLSIMVYCSPLWFNIIYSISRQWCKVKDFRARASY